MNYEKPILGCVNFGNDLKDIVNKNNVGFVTNSVNKDDLLKKAIYLIENKELRISMGKNGKKLLENKFSVFSATSKIEEAFY